MKTTRRSALTAILTTLPGTALFSQRRNKVTISYPNGGSPWPLFVAKEGGYYSKYGLDANLVLSVHPAGVAMLVNGEAQVLSYSLEQLLLAASSDPNIVLIASPTNRGTSALLAWKDIASVRDLKGRRIGVGLIGDANYSFTAVLLGKVGLSPKDVQWVPLGPDLSSRAAALTSRRIDAAMLTAPAYFKLESETVRKLVDFSQEQSVFVSSAIAMRRGTRGIDRELAKAVSKAHAEAVSRFYSDKTFAVATYMHFDPLVTRSDTEKLYDLYAKSNAFERVPYVLKEAVAGTIAQGQDEQIRARLRAFNFERVVDNSMTSELAEEGFLEDIFGNRVRSELITGRKAAIGFDK